MDQDAKSALAMAERKAQNKLGVSKSAAKTLVNPALERCASIATRLVGYTVEPKMDALMALGTEMMATIQAELKKDLSGIRAKQKAVASPGAFERAPRRNKFI